MILLAVYAVAVCVLAAKHRRRPLGFGVVLLGAALPLAALAGLKRIVPPSDETSPLSLELITFAESGFLLAMGLFLALLPRAHPGGMVCRRCRYNLAGLDPMGLDCPECGERWLGPGSGHAEREPERIPIPKGRAKKPHL